MKPIAGIQPPLRPMSPFGDRGTASSQSKSVSGVDTFGDLLTNQVKNVNSMQMDANDMVHSMLTGGEVNEAEVLTAVQKADLAFRMLLQVRNKLIEAYREIQQIQI
ncbi:MAG: flagellar hook-basal body complex protein FliE [Planctomycetota bacterium]